MHEPCLQWVIIAGETHHVSEFANLPSCQRPGASCPLCGKPVILKLGNERVHHAAHYEGATCAATQPETAIHLNSKYHIQKELSTENSLKLWHRCAGWTFDGKHYGCHKDSQQAVEYVRDWNSVQVEWSCGKYRLDVALLRDDQVLCVIEVLVTHPSEEGKIEYLQQQGVAWAEIRVTQDFYTSPTAWTAEMPLKAERYNGAILPSWTCKYCESALKKHMEDVEKAKFYEERRQKYLEGRDKKRQYAGLFERKAYRFIDFYFPSGKRFRKLYVIQDRWDKGKVLYADMQEVTQKWRQIALERSPVTKSSYQKLKAALEKELDNVERPDWIIDRTHQWQADSNKRDLGDIFLFDAPPYNYEQLDNKWQKVITKYRCTVCGKFVDQWVVAHERTKTCICTQCY